MRALVKFGKGRAGIAVRDIPEPDPAPGEIKVRVHAGGICGTDLHIMHDEYAYVPPVVMGHEYSGTVVAIGSGTTGFIPGDRVVSLTAASTCGSCRYCYEGLLMLCARRLSIGSGVDGAFAEYMVIPAHLAFHIPAQVSLDEAALCEPLACVVRGVIERATVKAGDYVLVSGPGTIGQLAMQVARACGGRVAVAGMDADAQRLDLAARTGAELIMAADRDDMEAQSLAFTDGHGFDVAFECAGAAASADSCLALLRKGGLYSQLGLFGEKILFNHDLALIKEISITNSFASERTSWVTALRLLAGKQVDVLPLASAKFSLAQWETAFALAEDKEGFKILLDPFDGVAGT